MRHKIKFFRNYLTFVSIILILTSCTMFNNNTAPIEGSAPFSVRPQISNDLQHMVVLGESLWKISVKYYKNPHLWPIIYKRNSDRIYDADLILPGDSIIISKKLSNKDKKRAILHSLNRGFWILGYQEEADQKFLSE